MHPLFAEIILLGVAIAIAVAVAGYVITTTHSTMETNPVRMLKIGEDSNLVICSNSANWSAVLYFPFIEKGTAPIKLYKVELENLGSFAIHYYLVMDRAPDPSTVCSLTPETGDGVLLRPGDKGYLLIYVPKTLQIPSGIPFYMNVILYSGSGELYLTVPVIQ